MSHLFLFCVVAFHILYSYFSCICVVDISIFYNLYFVCMIVWSWFLRTEVMPTVSVGYTGTALTENNEHIVTNKCFC